MLGEVVFQDQVDGFEENVAGAGSPHMHVRQPSPRKVNPTTEGCALHYIGVNWGQYAGTELRRARMA